MRSRFRARAALFALIALTLSVAEGVWASTCAPGMEMGTVSTAGAPLAAECTMDMAAQRDGTPERSDQPPDCPFGPVSASGSCAVAASLPAVSQVHLVPSLKSALLTVSPAQTRNLLLVSAFFRPPRA